MGLLDTLTGLFGGSSSKNSPLDMLKDGKLDANDLKDMATGELDSNNDGKLDAADLDVNQDGKTDLNDIEAAKDKLPLAKK